MSLETPAQLPERGLRADEIEQQLARFRANDLSFRDGKLWAYVYPAPDAIDALQKRAFVDYLSENGLDPTAFPSLVAMENQVLAIARAHLHGDEQTVGSFTTGGTESCMLAVKAARDHARHIRGIAEPELIFPVTAHAAFFKAAQYLDIKPIILPVDPERFTVRPADVAAAINERTALIVASAPSYAHGVIDPIEELGAIAARHNVLFHVDGCIGAFLLPWLRELGQDVPAFDFRVPGVTSISMDLHKYAFCPKGASLLLHRSAKLRTEQYFACASWTGYPMINPTILSSRSGGSVAAAWATLHAFGREGYLQAARDILRAREQLAAGIAEIPGLCVLGTPQSSLLAFASRGPSVFHIADEMQARGFAVQVQLALAGSPANLHLSLLPQSAAHAAAFLSALAESVQSAQNCQFGPLVAMVEQLAPQLSQLSPDAETVGAMLQQAGLDPRALPGRKADMNQVMNLLPANWREAVLKHVVGALYQP